MAHIIASSSSSSLPHRGDGYFHTTSPLGASHNPNPKLMLASNIILQFFGPIVQTVADCLLYQFPSSDDNTAGDSGATLSEIFSFIRPVCSRSGSRIIQESEPDTHISTDYPMTERDRILCNLRRKKTSSSVSWNRTKGSEERGYVVEESIIRTALLILVHHSLVRIRIVMGQHLPGKIIALPLKSSYKYCIDIQRILCIPRYARWVDWMRTKVFASTSHSTDIKSEKGGQAPSNTTANSSSPIAANLIGACLVEELCVHGRMLSLELLLNSRELLEKHSTSLSSLNIPQDQSNDTHEIEDIMSKSLIEVFKQLVDRGFIEIVPPISDSKEEDEMEADFSGKNKNNNSQTLAGQKRTFSDMQDENGSSLYMDTLSSSSYFPTISKLMQSPRYKRYFPPGAVWRINVEMFHAHIRAHYIGRLVHERYGDQVPSAGHIVSAALKCTAHREHSPCVQETTVSTSTTTKNNCATLPFPYISKQQRRTTMISGDASNFSPDDLMEFLAPQVLSTFQSKAGGARSQLSTALVSLSRSSNPTVMMEVENAYGHPKGGKFEVATRSIISFMKQLIAHQMVRDHHGEIAARISSILESRGYSESESIAEAAMVPSKDAREALHRLYKSNYIDLMSIQNTKQHNPGTAIYLWGIIPQRLQATVLNNVCRAFYNMRLRQQHEVQLGRQWLERANEASIADENEVEMDKIRFNNFKKGLERLDQACTQLDETLMALTCFV